MHETCFSLWALKQERLHIQHLYQTVCLCVGILYAVVSVQLEESVYPFVYLVFFLLCSFIGVIHAGVIDGNHFTVKLYCNYGDERLLFRDTK